MADVYNRQLCDERHAELRRAIDTLFVKIDANQSKIWAVLVMLFANLAGIVGILLR